MNALLTAWSATVARHPGATAVTDVPAGRDWTFAELAAEAERLAGSLCGQRVIVATGNDATFVVRVLAGWLAGALVCPVDEPSLAPAADFFDGVPRDTVLAKTTSGSTGTPRAVLFRAEPLLADAEAIRTTMGLSPALPNVAAISLAHSYGFANLVLPLLAFGTPLRLAGSPLPEAVRRALPPHGRCALPGVPAMWRAWQEAGVIDSRVAVAISAGAPLPLELEARVFARTGVKIHNFLGSSECGGIAYDRSDTPRTDASFAGRAMDGVDLSLDDEGRLVVRSAAVGQGYWPAAEDNSGALGEGFFRTQDLAELRDGALWLRGRAGDVINVAGRKLHPAELEAALRRHPHVAECCVFGVPSGDAGRLDEIVAVVSPSAADATAESLAAWLAEALPAWKLPRHWWVTAALEANARGKISRAAWRGRFLERAQAPFDPPPKSPPSPL